MVKNRIVVSVNYFMGGRIKSLWSNWFGPNLYNERNISIATQNNTTAFFIVSSETPQ